MNRRRFLIGGTVLSLLLVWFGMSCQTSSPMPTSAPALASTEVKISGFTYVPATITVAAGTTVTWTNQDSVPHTVTSETSLFDSDLARNASLSYSFTDHGTFSYYCAIHPSMRGKIIVE